MSDRLISRPRVEGWPLLAIAGLLITTIVLAGVSAANKREAARQQAARVVVANLQERALVFADGPGGDVLVRDHRTGEWLEPIVGEAGFARGVLRTLAQARLRMGGAQAEPFILSRNAANGLELSDPVSGRVIDLTSFGPDPARVFLGYLKQYDSPAVSRVESKGDRS